MKRNVREILHDDDDLSMKKVSSEWIAYRVETDMERNFVTEYARFETRQGLFL